MFYCINLFRIVSYPINEGHKNCYAFSFDTIASGFVGTSNADIRFASHARTKTSVEKPSTATYIKLRYLPQHEKFPLQST